MATPLIVFMAALTAAFMLLVLVDVVRTRRRGLAYAGAYGAGGSRPCRPAATASSRQALAPLGVVYAVGEEWSARSATGAEIPSGEPVRVVGQEGLTLIVEPATASHRTVGPAGDHVTSDQILPGAIVAVIVILVIVGRRAGRHAGGAARTRTPSGPAASRRSRVGTRGVAKTALAPVGRRPCRRRGMDRAVRQRTHDRGREPRSASSARTG